MIVNKNLSLSNDARGFIEHLKTRMYQVNLLIAKIHLLNSHFIIVDNDANFIILVDSSSL